MKPGGANQAPPSPGPPHERSHTPPPPPPSPKTHLPSGAMKTQLPTGARKHSPSPPQNFEVRIDIFLSGFEISNLCKMFNISLLSNIGVFLKL